MTTRIIIVGENRTEIIKVKNKDLDKHFVRCRGQLYKVYPHAFSRMRIYDIKGIEKESDEVIVFPENALSPFHDRGVPYDQDQILAEIDEHKFTESNGLLHQFRGVIGVARSLYPYIGLIIAGVVVVYALIVGGGWQF